MILKRVAEKINQVLEGICMVFLVMLFVLLLSQVLARFAKIPTMSWTDETIQFFLAWFVFLGTAVLVHKAEHISVGLLPDRLTGIMQKLLQVFILIIILVVAGFLIYGGSNLVHQMAGKKSPVLDLPQSFWYLSIPTSGVLIAFFSLAKLVENLKLIKRGDTKAYGE
ncbi:MAG: TRAP transporter small permease [Bacillota bacterium]